MANALRGEVDLVVRRQRSTETPEGVEKIYTLRMRSNDICEVQERTRKTFSELMTSLAETDYVSMRHMLWQFLQPHHRPDFQSLESAGLLIDDAGGFDAIFPVMMQLYQLNKPPQKDIKPSGRPRKAQVGTGESSTSTDAKSA